MLSLPEFIDLQPALLILVSTKVSFIAILFFFIYQKLRTEECNSAMLFVVYAFVITYDPFPVVECLISYFTEDVTEVLFNHKMFYIFIDKICLTIIHFYYI